MTRSISNPPTRNARWLALAAVAIMLTAAVPGTSGSGNEHLNAEQAEAFGRSTTHADVALILQEFLEEGATSNEPEFLLNADHIRVESDRADLAAFSLRASIHTEVASYDNAVIEGTEHRDYFLFSIWAIGENLSVTATDTSCSTIKPSEKNRIERLPMVNEDERQKNQTVLTDAMRWTSCDPHPSMEVTGDFLLRLWEWDAQLEVDGETRTLQSGTREFDDVTAIPADTSAIAGRSEEQFIYAYNATLQIPRLVEHHEIYIQDAQVSTPSGYRLSESTGEFLGITLDRQEVFLRGDDLSLTLAGTGYGEPLSLGTQGSVEHLEVDGTPRLIPSPEPKDLPPVYQLLAILGVLATAVVLVVGSGTVVWHVNPKLRHRIMVPLEYRRTRLFDEALMEAVEFNIHSCNTAVRWGRIATKLKPNHPEAFGAMGKALLNSKRYLESEFYYQHAIFAMRTEHRAPDVTEDAIAFWALDAIQCLVRVRFNTFNTTERDNLTEKILRHARMAWEYEPHIAESLLDSEPLCDLWPALSLTFNQNKGDVIP